MTEVDPHFIVPPRLSEGPRSDSRPDTLLSYEVKRYPNRRALKRAEVGVGTDGRGPTGGADRAGSGTGRSGPKGGAYRAGIYKDIEQIQNDPFPRT